MVPMAVVVETSDEIEARQRVSEICTDAIALSQIVDWYIDGVDCFQMNGNGETRYSIDMRVQVQGDQGAADAAARYLLARAERLNAFWGHLVVDLEQVEVSEADASTCQGQGT